MKSVRFNSLLASTALGLALMLASHPGMAQQTEQQKIDAGVPVPDTTLPPPPTTKDVGASDKPNIATPPQAAAEPKVEPKAEPAPAPVEKAAAPEPAKPAVVASGVNDQSVSDKLRDIVSGKQFDRVAPRKADRAGIEGFYKAHNYAPIWSHDGVASARAKSAIDYLAHADQVGLNAEDYPTPVFKSDMSADQLAEAELKLTQAALTFARHAQTGRVSWTRVSSDISFKEEAPDPAQVLSKLSDGDDAAKVLDAYNPPQPEFKALREKLAELRSGGSDEKKIEVKPAAPQVRVPEGKILRPGMKDERVIALRKRLDVAGDKNSPLYDDKVMEAVKAFQLSADLGSDGMLGPNTVRALNGQKVAEPKNRSLQNKIDTIVVNMERWRWYPRDLGDLHVIVNIPDFTLTLYDHDKVYWHTRIVAGKPGKTATPLTTAEMKFITVNPTWNVPPSIIENEYLPALQEDPDALERIGLKLEQNPDGTVRIYQPPGAGNALGRIRFNFPNKFLVYQHDTPDKYLFAKEERAFSHGCMRVQNPDQYASQLLSIALPKDGYTPEKIKGMYGRSELNINFPTPIPVNITYQTAFVDDAGKLEFRKDIYGRDAKMIPMLKGAEGKDMETAVSHSQPNYVRPTNVRVPGDNVASSNGPGFFERLFGAPTPPPAPVRGQRRVAR